MIQLRITRMRRFSGNDLPNENSVASVIPSVEVSLAERAGSDGTWIFEIDEQMGRIMLSNCE